MSMDNQHQLFKDSLDNMEKLFTNQLDNLEKSINQLKDSMEKKDDERKSNIESLRQVLEQTNIKVAKIETKLAIWGAGGGTLAVLMIKIIESVYKSK